MSMSDRTAEVLIRARVTVGPPEIYEGPDDLDVNSVVECFKLDFDNDPASALMEQVEIFDITPLGIRWDEDACHSEMGS